MPSAPQLRLTLIISIISLLTIKCGGETQDNDADKILKGVVIDYKTNRIGDFDRMVINTDPEKPVVHFPPHTAGSVMKAAPENKTAELTVRRSPKKGPVQPHGLELLSIKTPSGSFSLQSLPPMAPASGNEIRIAGKLDKFLYDDRGVVTALIIHNYLVELPPHLMKNLLPAINNSAEFVVKGYERNASAGFVNITGLRVVKPFAITINNTDYLL